MIAVSTSWCAGGLATPEDLIKRLDQLEIRAVELEYRIEDVFYHELKPLLCSNGVGVVSLHNFFPFPRVLHGVVQPGGDMFSLSSLDKELRGEAVERTARTIEHAHELECRHVVIHCGKVEMDSGFHQVRRHYEEGTLHQETAQVYLRMKMEERAFKVGPHMDALCFSLEKLIKAAVRENVMLGLENRYHYHELPGIEEFKILFKEFDGAPIGYWHDTGHARVGEIMFLTEPNELIRQFGKHLAGIHLHDAKGLEDHLPPGHGEIDFSLLGPMLGPHTVRVMELKPGTSDEAVTDGLGFLAERLFSESVKPAEKKNTGLLIIPGTDPADDFFK